MSNLIVTVSVILDKSIIHSVKCKKAIKNANNLIKGKGRMLVRKSGTEPKIRIMCESENKVLLSKCVKIVKKRVPVIAGTGSNNTIEAIEFTQHAEKCGADAALVVTPYYNKPTQEGLYQHFKRISETTALPIIIYNIPGRSIVDMSIDTMAKLSEIKNINGVKDATNDLFRPLLTQAKIKIYF